MEGNVRSVRSYKKTPIITVPETPDYLQHLLLSASSASLPPSPSSHSVGNPGPRVAVRPRMEIDEGKRPRRKVPIRLNAERKESPQELIK